jgi:hypothetical protein
LLQPGQRIVIAENAEACRARYGATTPVFGVFTGNLSNGGERILVTGPGGIVIRNFMYDDVAPWPTPADGVGFSLVLNHPRSAPDHAIGMNWRASATVGGAPGVVDAAPMPSDPAGDEDGDGVSNLLAYATAGRPQVLVERTVTVINGQAAEYLIIRHAVNRAADGFTACPETTNDLVNWVADCVHVGTEWNADGTATHSWRSSLPIGLLGPRYYVRIRVQM